MKVKLEIIQGALVMALIILFSTSISNAEAGKTTVSENLSRTTTWVGSSVQAVANNAGINSGTTAHCQ